MKCRYVGGKYMHFMTVNIPAGAKHADSWCTRKGNLQYPLLPMVPSSAFVTVTGGERSPSDGFFPW
jgi:hypothetical protein